MYRRDFIKHFTYLSSLLCLNHLFNKSVFANEALKILSINIAKVTKTWDEMSVEADVPISFYEKRGSADELIKIFSKVLISVLRFLSLPYFVYFQNFNFCRKCKGNCLDKMKALQTL